MLGLALRLLTDSVIVTQAKVTQRRWPLCTAEVAPMYNGGGPYVQLRWPLCTAEVAPMYSGGGPYVKRLYHIL